MTTSSLGAFPFTARYLCRRGERRQARGQAAAGHRDLARAARAGYAPAQYRLARAYQLGQGCPRSGTEAAHWYRAAAEAGHTDAQFELGSILLRPRDFLWEAGASAAWMRERGMTALELTTVLFRETKQDGARKTEAFTWLLCAAEGGKPEAQANLGWLLLTGTGCKADRSAAFRWLNAAAAHNIGQAALGLSEFYAAPNTSEHDLAMSTQWAKRAAELGNSSGAYRFACALRDGTGIATDAREAERYFAQAAKGRHRTAGYDGAVLGLARVCTETELAQMLERLRDCAKCNYVPAMVLLAELNSQGERMKLDLCEAARWYRQAAAHGYAPAQFMIGCLYARGEGVEADLRTAAHYFERAAEVGHVQAAYNLGVFRLNGQGIECDLGEAKRWFAVAAEAGLTHAQLRLGQILAREATDASSVASAHALIEQAALVSSEAKVALARLHLTEGSETSRQQAIELLRAAVRSGNVESCEMILGIDALEDHAHAIAELRRVADAGNSRAMVSLARALLAGKHQAQNTEEAVRLLQQAANLGDPQAHFELGIIYCQGNILSKSIERGFKHYLEAATRGHAIGQYNVGLMLLQGHGTNQTSISGIDWIRQACNNELPHAIELLAKIEDRAKPSSPTQ